MLLYQGQLDVRDGVAATEAWLANWSWAGRRASGAREKLGCRAGIAATTGVAAATHLTVNARASWRTTRPHEHST